jgi:Zn-dependent oligopeptidase
MHDAKTDAAAAVANPLSGPRRTPHGLPPFGAIAPEHFRPAFDGALARHREVIDRIAATPEAASFDNTIAALEQSFEELSRISAVFYALNGAHTNDALEAVALEISPLLARHYSEIFQHEGLYGRIAALQAERDRLGLDAEQRRVLERYHMAFVRAGAALAPAERTRLAEINERLALAGTRFSQNVLADEKAYTLVLEGEGDLAGLPDFVRQAARAMLSDVWEPARRRALEERDDLQTLARQEGANFAIAPWDWRYYAEKVRKARFDLDEAQIKPYLQLDRVIEAAFYVAGRLFGLTFAPVAEVPTYHPDVRVWEVRAADGRLVGLFLGDYFARPSKRSGAWMMSLRDQEKLAGDITPIIVNVMNFSKPEAGEPALLSFDDARTLFHEFGHGLHGLLSNVTYPLLSGTSVATDFVELPSQLFEHWLEQPEVLSRFAAHYRTGQPMPKELVERIRAARNFNQGFGTVEYLASAIVDLDFHQLADGEPVDAADFERTSLARIGMPEEIVMRHRSPHFTHVFSGEGYAAAYYSYMWSEMLDADGFAAFREAGDVFDRATARRLHDYVYSAGNLRDPAEAYTLFRGALPKVDAVLAKRGLDRPASEAA